MWRMFFDFLTVFTGLVIMVYVLLGIAYLICYPKVRAVFEELFDTLFGDWI